MPGMKRIVKVQAHESETLEIVWWLRDGTKYIRRVTVAPTATRDTHAKGWGSGDDVSEAEPEQLDDRHT
jgi:hypothetical protein